jgi:hypothetical protein
MGTMPSTFRKRKTADYKMEPPALSTLQKRRAQTHERPASGPFGVDIPRGAAKRLGQPPRRIMSKKSRLVLLAFILSSMNSIASISSIG